MYFIFILICVRLRLLFSTPKFINSSSVYDAFDLVFVLGSTSEFVVASLVCLIPCLSDDASVW